MHRVITNGSTEHWQFLTVSAAFLTTAILILVQYQKTIFSALRASVWSKNKEGAGPSGSFPGSAHWIMHIFQLLFWGEQNKNWYRWQLRVIILKSTSEGRCSALKPSTDLVRPTNSSFAELRSICSIRCSLFYYLALLFYLAYFHHTFSEQIMF